MQAKCDRWLLNDGRFMSPNFLPAENDEILVWHLIDHDARKWNIDTLRAVFDGPTFEHILAIPLSLLRLWRIGCFGYQQRMESIM